jgi:hypothetical protein
MGIGQSSHIGTNSTVRGGSALLALCRQFVLRQKNFKISKEKSAKRCAKSRHFYEKSMQINVATHVALSCGVRPDCD